MMVRQFNHSFRPAVLFWVFTFCAIPIAVIVVTYASGYRVAPKTTAIIQTAALTIETHPRKATVFINESPSNERTPFFGDNILPGSAKLTVQKNNFHSWEKTVTFVGGRSEIFPNIVLFRISNPQPLETNRAPERRESLQTRAQFFPVEPSRQLQYSEEGAILSGPLFALNGPFTLVTSAQQHQTVLLASADHWDPFWNLPLATVDAQWHDNQLLLIRTEYELWLAHASTQKLELVYRSSEPLRSATWHPDGDDILFATASGIFALELDPRDGRELWQLASVSNAEDLLVHRDADLLSWRHDDAEESYLLK